MAQWQDLLRLDSTLQAQVKLLYEGKFPRMIRHYLSVPIESQDWDLAAVDENKARTCFSALLVCLEEQWNRSVQENNILQGPDFPQMKDYLLQHFGHQPLKLARILSECIKEEKKILTSASEAQGLVSPAVDQKWKELDNRVNELKRQTLEVNKKMKPLESLYKDIDLIKNWQGQVVEDIGHAQSHALVDGECLKRTNLITYTTQVVQQQILNILKLAQEILVTLTDVELPEWKRRQQMACIGCTVDTCLDHLQKWFTAVAEVLLQVREHLQKLQEQNKKFSSTDASSLPGPNAELETLTLSLLTKLLTNALVVEKQPLMSSLPQRPLILKTKVRLTAAVRFLANLPEFKKLLKVEPVFDKDVEEAKTVKGFRHFDFDGDDRVALDVDSPGGDLVAEFGHMLLKARGKGSNKSVTVTEELHIIKFVTQFQYAGLTFNIEASSLPVVVISSTSQVASAWASVMWYNILLSTSEPWNLSVFVDPPPVSWEQLSQVLSWQFLSAGQRELNEDQLSMLRDKIVDDPDGLVQWSKFSMDNGVWTWIDGILDLTKKYLVDHWRDGSIMGFVSRERTQALLQQKQSGTFLLRFSETNLDGAVSFSWVDHSNGETYVHPVKPCTKEELSTTPLADIIDRYSVRVQGKTYRNPLLYLYPDTHRDDAFGRYYTVSEKSAPIKMGNGYVGRTTTSVSENPTPPPSPPRDTSPPRKKMTPPREMTPTSDVFSGGGFSPRDMFPLREMPDMDMDVDVDMDVDPKVKKARQLAEDLFSSLLDLPELPDLLPYCQEMESSN